MLGVRLRPPVLAASQMMVADVMDVALVAVGLELPHAVAGRGVPP